MEKIRDWAVEYFAQSQKTMSEGIWQTAMKDKQSEGTWQTNVFLGDSTTFLLIKLFAFGKFIYCTIKHKPLKISMSLEVSFCSVLFYFIWRTISDGVWDLFLDVCSGITSLGARGLNQVPENKFGSGICKASHLSMGLST